MKFHTLTVWVQYRNYPADRTLKARVRQYAAGSPSYGANLLKGFDGEDINSALSLVANKLHYECSEIEFKFEPLLKCPDVLWKLA